MEAYNTGDFDMLSEFADYELVGELRRNYTHTMGTKGMEEKGVRFRIADRSSLILTDVLERTRTPEGRCVAWHWKSGYHGCCREAGQQCCASLLCLDHWYYPSVGL